MRLTLFTLLLVLFSACRDAKHPANIKIEQPHTNAIAQANWIEERVAKAEKVLSSSTAGQLVWQAMEAHGGLKNWYSNGPLSFQFDYQPRGKGARRNSKQTVDTWSNRAVHHDIEKPSAAYGWDGDNAWVTKEDTAHFEYNLRFWALTPIFFLAQPFNFDGEGVNLEHLDDKTLNGKLFDAVKVSFAKGTGDAPDDYYINYYDKNSHQLEALRYIVSYPKYFKDGGHSPEKIMTLHDYTVVNGISFPTRYKTYMLTADEQLGEYVTDIEVSEIAFDGSIESSYFEIPAGAHIIEEL